MILPQTDLAPNLTCSNHHNPWYTMHTSIPALYRKHLSHYLFDPPPTLGCEQHLLHFFFLGAQSWVYATFTDSVEQKEELSPGGRVLYSCSFLDVPPTLASPGSGLKGCAGLGCRLKAGQ